MISFCFRQCTDRFMSFQDPLIKEVYSEARQIVPRWTNNYIAYKIAQIAPSLLKFSSTICVLRFFYHVYKLGPIEKTNLYVNFFYFSFVSIWGLSCAYVLVLPMLVIAERVAKITARKLHSSLFRIAINDPSGTSSTSLWNKLQKHGKSVIDLDFTSSPALYLTNEKVSRIAKVCPNLESLAMDARLLTKEGLQELNTYSPKIRSLTLINCKNLNRDYYKALEKFKYLRCIDIKRP